MNTSRPEHRDTTIKDKLQPIDVTDDAGDVEDLAEEILEHSTNVETDEEKLIHHRPGIGALPGSAPDER